MNATGAQLATPAEAAGSKVTYLTRPSSAQGASGSPPGITTSLRWTSLQDAGMHFGTRPLIERLNDIEGFDLTLGLRYTGGQMQMLARALRRFVAIYRHGVPTLLDASGDEHQVVLRWRTACHSVRGALSLIGAMPLVEETSQFELALRDLASRARLSARGQHLHEGVMALAARLAAALED